MRPTPTVMKWVWFPGELFTVRILLTFLRSWLLENSSQQCSAHFHLRWQQTGLQISAVKSAQKCVKNLLKTVDILPMYFSCFMMWNHSLHSFSLKSSWNGVKCVVFLIHNIEFSVKLSYIQYMTFYIENSFFFTHKSVKITSQWHREKKDLATLVVKCLCYR